MPASCKAATLLIQLPVNSTQNTTEDHPRVWIPAIYVGALGKAADFIVAHSCCCKHLECEPAPVDVKFFLSLSVTLTSYPSVSETENEFIQDWVRDMAMHAKSVW